MKAYEAILDAADRTPDKPAIEFPGGAMTFGGLVDESMSVLAGLQELEVPPGEAVAVMLPNLPQYVSVLMAIWMNGDFMVPFNVLLTPREISYLCCDCRPRCIFTHAAFLPQLEQGIAELESPPRLVVIGSEAGGHVRFADFLRSKKAARIQPSDTGTVILTLYTSGTTGSPKGAMIANSSLEGYLRVAEGLFPPEEGDKGLIVLPLFHAYALIGGAYQALRQNATAVLKLRFEVEEAIHSLANEGITHFLGVPTMYHHILHHPDIENVEFPRLKVCFTGGAPMPVELHRAFEARFGAPIYEGFGMTETTMAITTNRPGENQKIGSVGLPYEGVEIRIVGDTGEDLPDGEVGEIVIRTPSLMKGYLNRPEDTARVVKDGWYFSADMGYRDLDGYIYIVGRMSDMIIKGGYNIYPAEIEGVILELEEIAEAAVVGVPDEAKGEVIWAFLAIKPDRSFDRQRFLAHLEANLAKYKLPQRVLFGDELPKGPTGKTLKRELVRDMDRWRDGGEEIG
jgi:long-chain acyl-CoA synthetase